MKSMATIAEITGRKVNHSPKGFVSFLLAIKFEFVLEFKLFITD
jgi:hypothetical protein